MLSGMVLSLISGGLVQLSSHKLHNLIINKKIDNYSLKHCLTSGAELLFKSHSVNKRLQGQQQFDQSPNYLWTKTQIEITLLMLYLP